MSKDIKLKHDGLLIIGDNFIAKTLLRDFKRYGKFKLSNTNSPSNIKKQPNYIIDCSLNKNTQDLIIEYCSNNSVDKLLIINHWERTDLKEIDTTVVQCIVYDVYGDDHISLHRPGVGNSYEPDIKYCTLISETIRRIHEAKVATIPILKIPYGEGRLKYSSIDNIFRPINHILNNPKIKPVVAIYDDYKNSASVVSIIQSIINYEGEVVFVDERTSYTKDIERLNILFKCDRFDYSVKNLYKRLKINNPRFLPH